MSILERLACMQGKRDEIPNQELARALAAQQDRKGIKEIAENLWNKDSKISSDCIKVLYEIGYLKPELIANYVGDFLKLLSSRNNRLVWGSMITLSTIAELTPDEIYVNRNKIIFAIENGSVITIDNGIKVLARVAAAKEEYSQKIFPYLIAHLETCRPKEIAQHAESTLCAVNAKNKKKFIAVLSKRQEALAASQSARIKKILKAIEGT